MFTSDVSTVIRYTNIFINRSLSGTDISSSEYYILMYLFNKDNVSQDEISLHYAINKGSISKTINSLVKKNYVTKNENPKNRRENITSLTVKGKETFRKHKAILDKWHNSLLTDISVDDFLTVKRVMKQLSHTAKLFIDKET